MTQEELKARVEYEKKRTVDDKILSYEFHYIREAIQYIRKGSVDNLQHYLKLLEKRVNTAANTVGRLIEEGKI